MQKGVESRLIAHLMLNDIREKNINFDEALSKQIKNYNISKKDINLIQNIVLTSMRFHLSVNKIIKKYVLKKINSKQSILFLSAITQIVYLDFKNYAVVNCTVELAKNKKINVFHGFVNAVLKNVIRDKDKLQKIKVEYSELPNWFTKKTANFSDDQKKLFMKSIIEKPSLHLVFKEKNKKEIFENHVNSTTTSDKSLILFDTNEIEKLPGYNNGDWWIQDYSTMIPLSLINNLKNKKIIDLCSAPGGKAFQSLSAGANVSLIEINKKRSAILNENLKRLNFNVEIEIADALNINHSQKYDYVIIDAPCSAVGTIRRNPEIFFKKENKLLDNLIDLQKKLLNKATELVSENGIIIYMVCSFLKVETYDQVDNFLKKNNNFIVDPYPKKLDKNSLIDDNGFLNTIPKKIEKYNIDGFFSVKLKKND